MSQAVSIADKVLLFLFDRPSFYDAMFLLALVMGFMQGFFAKEISPFLKRFGL